MNSRTLAAASSLLAWLLALGCPNLGLAQDTAASVDPTALLAPLVNEDTFAVAYLNLDEANHADQLRKLILQLPQQTANDTLLLNAIAQSIGGLQSAGASGMYVVCGLGDAQRLGGPLVVICAKRGADQAMLENILRGATQSIAVLHGLPPLQVERRGPDALVMGTEATMARYKSLHSSARADLVEPMTRLVREGAGIAAVFSPGPDFRRVVRELWPAFPPPLAAWKGELADDWLRLEFVVKEFELASATLTLETNDPKSAEQFVQLLNLMPNATEQLAEDDRHRTQLRRVLSTIVDALTVRVEGPRVVLTLTSDNSRLTNLKGLFDQAAATAAESAQRSERANQFKHIALAFYMYEDAHKHLPPAAIRDAAGKPLLSWRVAILPYLDNYESLYEQFHLEEPWDSPHNLALAKNLPAIFSDPGQKTLTTAGKTTYLRPVGPGTLADSVTGNTLREITDGSSRTLLMIEVPPENAVIWTKPDDWEVDLADPLRGVARTDRDYIVAAWADGSVQAIRTDVKPEAFKAYLTRAGNETVDRP